MCHCTFNCTWAYHLLLLTHIQSVCMIHSFDDLTVSLYTQSANWHFSLFDWLLLWQQCNFCLFNWCGSTVLLCSGCLTRCPKVAALMRLWCSQAAALHLEQQMEQQKEQQQEQVWSRPRLTSILSKIFFPNHLLFSLISLSTTLTSLDALLFVISRILSQSGFFSYNLQSNTTAKGAFTGAVTISCYMSISCSMWHSVVVWVQLDCCLYTARSQDLTFITHSIYSSH